MLFAEESSEHARYFPEMLPFLPFFAPRLDELAANGHLTNVRPHLPKLSPHLKYILPLMDRFVACPDVTANADVLVFYFGWSLAVPGVRSVVLPLWFAMPGGPQSASHSSIQTLSLYV